MFAVFEMSRVIAVSCQPPGNFMVPSFNNRIPAQPTTHCQPLARERGDR
jgi:hypothetical protein